MMARVMERLYAIEAQNARVPPRVEPPPLRPPIFRANPGLMQPRRALRRELDFDDEHPVLETEVYSKAKVKIPPFEGKCDADVYLIWEAKVEQIWSCHNVSDTKKVQYAALEFTGYSLMWWNNLLKERRRMLDEDVTT